MRVRQAQKEGTRALLVQTGLRLFNEKGFAATTVDEITAAAGVAKGTFYNYFKTKEDVAVAAVASVLRDVSGAEGDLFAACPTTRERFYALFDSAAAWVGANPELTWVWALERLRRGRADTEGEPSGMNRLVTAVYAAGQAAGDVRGDRAAAHLALELEGVFLAYLATWHHTGRSFDLATAMRRAIDTNLDGTGAIRPCNG